MKKKHAALGVPDILAVREDKSERDRSNNEGGPSSTDVLSIYTKGGPRYSLNRKVYNITPPVAMLLPKGAHDNDLQEGKVNGIFVLFNGYGLLRKKRLSDTEITVAFGDHAKHVPVLRHIHSSTADRLIGYLHGIRERQSVDLASSMHIVSLLLRAVAVFCDADARGTDLQVHREARRLRELIQEWAYEYTALEKIYEKLNISAAHAETLFRKAFGITPIAYRNKLRLMQARELLVSTQNNVSEVAYKVGYTDPLYFSRVFRKTYGVPPSDLISHYETSRNKVYEE